MKIVEAKLGKEHHRIGDILYELGCLYFVKPEDTGTGKVEKSWTSDKSEVLLIKALKLKEAVGPDHPEVARIATRLGSLYIERVDFPSAELHLKRALKIREEKLGNLHSRVSQTLRHLLTLYESQEKFAQAIEIGKRALTIERRTRGEDHPIVGNILVRLGQLYFVVDGSGSYEGKKYFEQAIQAKEHKHGKDSPQAKELIKLLYELEHPNAVQEKEEEKVVITFKSKSKSTPMPIPVSNSNIKFDEGGVPLPPPPPPPGLLSSGAPPPPPPPPGSKQVPTPSADLNLLLIKPDQLKKAIDNRAQKKKAVAGDWWQQNYAYAKK